MHVPSDSFGGVSPERKASQALRNLCTFTAAKIVLSQLEGSGRGGLASYDTKAYADLREHMENEPLRDDEAWISALLRKNELLGLRVLEVRLVYAKEQFEWDMLQGLTKQTLEKSNLQLIRKHAADTFERSFINKPEE